MFLFWKRRRSSFSLWFYPAKGGYFIRTYVLGSLVYPDDFPKNFYSPDRGFYISCRLMGKNKMNH